MTSKVLRDHNSQTCIEFYRKKNVVWYTPLDISGLELKSLPESEFDSVYSEIPDYKVEQAATLYTSYAETIGATKEVMDELGKIIKISQDSLDKALEKVSKREEKKLTKKKKEEAMAEPKLVKPTVAVKKVEQAEKKVSKPEVKPVKKEPEEPRQKRPSASQMFKDLIMEGKLDEMQIFKKVQEEFNLDDNKFSYVNWNYQDLLKKGLNPPALKRVKK